MALPAPNLDDRRYEDLVADAVAMVRRTCPEWTDQNPSDPGMTLIETFAYLSYQLIYRLNQVPDRVRLKFLDLIGLRLHPPTPAQAGVTFWLSAPASATLVVPAGTEAGTLRTDAEPPVVFSTVADLRIIPCAVLALFSRYASTEHTTRHPLPSVPVAVFTDEPVPGDTLLVGLDTAAPRCAVRLDVDCEIAGLGVDPSRPPLVWEAHTADGWVPCDVGTDETGGLNRPGAVVLHLPPDHAESVFEEVRAGWLRARVVSPAHDTPGYTASPILRGLSGCTTGATADVVHAELVAQETIGTADGTPGQVFALQSGPVLGGLSDPVVETSSDTGWDRWHLVVDFAASGPADRHFMLDPVAGEILFGPAVRLPDGTLSQYGAVPPRDAVVRVRGYAIGGGARGNVSARTVRTLRTSVPFVAAVENRHSAQGGTEGETLDEAADRGPLLLRTRNRAVTAEDYEFIGRKAVPEIARIRCLTGSSGEARVLVVPAAADPDGRIRFADLVPDPQLLARLAEHLDEVRVIGTRVVVEPPRYRGITVVARLIAKPRAPLDRVRDDALGALYNYLNPLCGGPSGHGWPFGRTVRPGDVYPLLQEVRGVACVEDLRLFTANPVTGERGNAEGRIELSANSLVFSFEHQVRVEAR
ncbi:putative baseplate assembly protein [Actinosynnema sp. ALI-1.44]|uniref:putative baseplate assembly protein n=1 Tax=Actinosynnema sp. ALI-1.44 TaxID=1933779 RepID=UPI00097C02ED|nr:putative baseplate assembly protein [Actinosynnema sp. ALI-1.44]ONI81532.1 putative baseplate assembly protein [Actinosynnema sp. ALI-1.44]